MVIDGLPQRTGMAGLQMRRVASRSYRLRPWPFAGHRLQVYAEGLFPSAPMLPATANLRVAQEVGERCNFAWTLLAPGTPAD